MERILKIEVFKGSDHLWYWRLRASNGRVVADSAEAYLSKGNVLRAVKNVQRKLVHTIEIVEIET
jgi:uncharacterized protein YegP (UPF0339 family)